MAKPNRDRKGQNSNFPNKPVQAATPAQPKAEAAEKEKQENLKKRTPPKMPRWKKRLYEHLTTANIIAALAFGASIYAIWKAEESDVLANEAYLRLVDPKFGPGHMPGETRITFDIVNAGKGIVQLDSSESRHEITTIQPPFEQFISKATDSVANDMTENLGEDDKIDYHLDINGLLLPGMGYNQLTATIYFGGQISYRNLTLSRKRVFKFMYKLEINRGDLKLSPIIGGGNFPVE